LWSVLCSRGLGRSGAPLGCLACAGFDGSGLDAALLDGAGFEGASFDCPPFKWTDFDFDLPAAGLLDFELDFFLEAIFYWKPQVRPVFGTRQFTKGRRTQD